MKMNAIGLMSGTSLDGLDICYASFSYTDRWHFEILKSETLSYDKMWENRLRHAFHSSAEDLMALHSDYGFYLGEKVSEFIAKHSITDVEVIASHGHTIFHQPHRNFTTQIGDGRAIKIRTNIPTVYDFRTQDVLLGGNGAPLVPIGDELIFSEFDACINLGGFSNISFKKDKKRIAFDICPVNIVLNPWAKDLGFPYDKDGQIAATHEIDYPLLQEWNSLEFYKLPPPKSLGMEWVNQNFLKNLKEYRPEKLLATATEHAAVQISKTLNENNLQKVLITGGGAYNQHLIKRIQALTQAEIILPHPEIINFKEALIFGFMGVLKLQNLTNVLSSTTGAKYDHSTGVIA